MHKRITIVMFSLGIITASAGCARDNQPEDSPSLRGRDVEDAELSSAGSRRWPGSPQLIVDAAVAAFWRTYHGNDYAGIARAQALLHLAIGRDPDNPTLHALLGATHFWHVSEAGRDPAPDPSVLLKDLPTAVQAFQRAVDLDTAPGHPIQYINDDHLPGYAGVTLVHLGQATRDSSLVAAGSRTLDTAVYQFPEFNNFNLWAAFNQAPKDSDAYKVALEALWNALDLCADATLDRSNPDLQPYFHLYTTTGRKRVCWQNEMAPFSFEGIMYNFGNGLVKAGQIEAAKIMYANAQLAPNYDAWPYRQQLEQVMSSDLHARAALYADGDPGNDPPLNIPGRGCVYCHATVPEP